MQRDIKVAAISIPCPGGQPDRMVDEVRGWARLLSMEGVEVLCLPEACLTGYSVGPEAEAWAQPLTAPPVQSLREVAREHSVHLLIGMMERSELGALHLTQLAIGPRGDTAVYRKAHLSPQEKRVFASGALPGLVDMGDVIGGVALCYETHFPEWIGRLALLGAEVLFFPSASPRESPREKMERWLRYMPARAYDNSAFVVACNQGGDNGAGLRFPAVAMVIDPKGRVLAAREAEQEAVVLATLEAGELTRIRSHAMAYFLSQRRPELYGGNPDSGVRSQESE
jgi:predicted amidohydrolase